MRRYRYEHAWRPAACARRGRRCTERASVRCSHALPGGAHTQVADLKAQIEREKNMGGTIKLIHAGKVLVDTQTIEEAGVKEGGFLVCMVTKAKVIVFS